MKNLDVTPTPWKAKGVKIDSHAISIGECYYENEANAAHIVHCVNTHDELVEALKIVTDFPKEDLEHYEQYGVTMTINEVQFKKIMEALKKANS